MNIVIVGLGETGFAVANYFAKMKVPVSVIDSRDAPPKLSALKEIHPEIPVYLGGFSKAVLAKADQIILSPGIPKDHPDILNAVSPKTEIIGEIELFARALQLNPKPVIAITGSNGKSTVTTLLGEMAKNAGIKVGIGGNLGTPALDLLSQNPDLYVLELSSFQLETTDSLKPKAATVLNVCEDHMDRYNNIDEYYAAKQRIYKNTEFAIVNRDDLRSAPISVEGTGASHLKTLTFGLDDPKENDYGLHKDQNEFYLVRGQRRLLPSSALKMFGRHNMANALAALALGEALGLPEASMLETLKNFKGLAHRCEWIRTLNGVQWINDSKGTNVGATVSALEGLSTAVPGKWVLIAGGVGKNADFSPLKSVIQTHCRAVILIGEAAKELYALLNPVVPCFRVQSMQEAVQFSYQQAKPGDGVLLSPACASFDMFKNFEHRGEEFKKFVLKLD